MDPTRRAASSTATLLFTVAYEIIGSVADAEDVVQETWLRWADVDHDGGPRPARLPGPDRHPAGAQPAAHRRAAAREDYVGPWLPEPLLTAPDVAEDVELAESVSMAMLVRARHACRRLERAVFVLREVFGFAHDEIAEAVGQVAGRGPPDRQPGPRARAGPAARPVAEPPRRDAGGCSASWPRPPAATCRS